MCAEAIVEAGDRVTVFADGADEFPDEVVTEDGGWFALLGIARAGLWFQEFCGDIDRDELLVRFAGHDLIGHVEAMDGRGFGAVDLGPLLAEAFEAVALGECGAFSDAGGAALKFGNEAGPVVDFARRTILAIDGFGARRETRFCATAF